MWYYREEAESIEILQSIEILEVIYKVDIEIEKYQRMKRRVEAKAFKSDISWLEKKITTWQKEVNNRNIFVSYIETQLFNFSAIFSHVSWNLRKFQPLCI